MLKWIFYLIITFFNFQSLKRTGTLAFIIAVVHQAQNHVHAAIACHLTARVIV